MSRIWIDVEDLFAYAAAFRRPSGIQRVVFELCQALTAVSPDSVGFLRHAGRDGFAPVAWAQIAELFASMSRPQPAPPPRSAWHLQRAALRAMAGIATSLLPPRPPASAGPPAFAPGDTLLVAGAGWDDPGHTARLIATRRRHRLRLSVLVYDLIPLRRPEWTAPQTAARFRVWLDALLTEADDLLAISHATAADVAWRRNALGLPALPARVIRLGDGFSAAPPGQASVDGRYALFVSTIEIRKNHALLVAAWRELLSRHDRAAVPKLVFVGREGPLSGDMMRSLRASRLLDGHVVLRPDANDSELAALYEGCSFTLFPSLYEGWGLPVAESLCFGKPCLAARATSVPEVAGDLARYFDPMNLADTVAAIERVMSDDAALAAWEAEICAGFQPTDWSVTAQQILADRSA